MRKKNAYSMANVGAQQRAGRNARSAGEDDALFASVETAMLAVLDSFLWTNDRDALLDNLELLSRKLSAVQPERLRPLLTRNSPSVDAALHMVRVWDCGRGAREKNGMFSPPPPVPYIAFLLAPTAFLFSGDELDAVRGGAGYGVEDVREWHGAEMRRLVKERAARPVRGPVDGAERKRDAS